MKVESSKTNQTVNKNQTVNNSESIFRTTSTASTIITPQPPTTGAFEKILNENRKQSGKDEATTAKSDHRSETSEPSELKKDEKKAVEEKRELKERDQNKGDGGKGESGDENENPTILNSTGFFSNGKVSGETSIPAARSILHVTDLERIVSTLRTIETKNSQQVLISLKNSVLEGLEIKLTVDENGKLKAEFLALNEKIKEQLKARKNELSEIFKNRGVKFQQLEIRIFSENEDSGNNSPQADKTPRSII